MSMTNPEPKRFDIVKKNDLVTFNKYQVSDMNFTKHKCKIFLTKLF